MSQYPYGEECPSDLARTPLWHGKELYEPRRIVHAAVLSALYLCRTSLVN